MTAAVDGGPMPGMVVSRSRAARGERRDRLELRVRPQVGHGLQVVDVVQVQLAHAPAPELGPPPGAV